MNWTIGRRLGAMAAVAVVLIASLALLASSRAEAVRNDAEIARNHQTARAYYLRLDTRSSELKVDALRSLVQDPQQVKAEFEDDATTITDILADLRTVDLHPDDVALLAQVSDRFDDYIANVGAFIDGAIVDQQAQRARSQEVQEGNHVMDELLGQAIESLSADADKGSAGVVDSAHEMNVIFRIGLLLGIVVMGAIAWFVSRSVTRPLKGVMRVLDAFAKGDLSRRIEVDGGGDLAALQRSVNSSLDSVSAIVTAVDQSASSLASATQQMTATSEEIASGAAETTAQAAAVSAAAGQVSGTVAEVSSNAAQMNASIAEIAHSANEAVRTVGRAVDLVDLATGIIGELGSSSQEINEVVKVITSIAEQTNLLALNATIEAARAGDYGKGFAVVATEVKDLAQGTGRATGDIIDQVATIQRDTARAVEAIQEISRVIVEVNDFQLTIAAAVEEQTATTNEIVRAVHVASDGSGDIAASIGGVATAMEMTTAAVNDSLKATDELARMARDLQAEVGRFQVA